MDAAEARAHFLAICQRLKANVERGAPDSADDVVRIPASAYQDDALYEKELQQIFMEVPLLVALSCDIPTPGDFVTLNLLDQPLLIVRGNDDKARVFLNICRHRGAALTTEPCGNKRVFSCPYHAWTFDRQGALRGVPDSEAFGDHGVEGLIELPSDEAAGTIFCSLNRDNPVSIEN